ncbi:hypothetical protein GCM10022198_04660 [Klugiella xanthotipulae]
MIVVTVLHQNIDARVRKPECEGSELPRDLLVESKRHHVMNPHRAYPLCDKSGSTPFGIIHKKVGNSLTIARKHAPALQAHSGRTQRPPQLRKRSG